MKYVCEMIFGKGSVIVLVLLCLSLFGCADLMERANRDPRDAPWDPPPGASLFDQLPPQIYSSPEVATPQKTGGQQ
jgi:hypothetical protein